MKINDLKRYKPLDITELSGSPWNNAEKVLGLDENDKVIMAEPDDVVTPEYVADAVNQAMEAETARTEDAYAKKDEIPDMEDYYTKEEVDETISGITVDLSDYYTKGETDQAISSATQDMATEQYVNDAIADIPPVDLSGYALISSVTADINTAISNETARTESTYAKPSDIPSLDGYATETYVDDAIAAIPQVDLSGYAKTTAVTEDIQTAMASETARTESTYAKPSQIPSLDGYATEQWVESQGYLTEHQDLSAYAKTTAVTEDIQTAMATETGRTEEVYAKKSEIPSLDGYATQAWTTGDTESRIASAMASETARTESTYLKEHQSLDDYYTKSQVDAEITGATEGLASEQYVNDAIAAIPGVDLSPYAKTTAVTQDIQTAMAAETARTESTYLKEHQSLDNYYTKSEVDADFVSAATEVGNAIDAAVDGLASEDYVDNAVSGLASEDYVNNVVTAATENLASESYVDAAITSATQNLATEEYVVDAIATAITIDDQLSTGSTNPVQNQVITNALDNKASKANVDANTNARYFPQWNSDGIIIGKFGNIVYNVSYNINGLTYYILRNKNSGGLPTIYAPTSAGTQGQVLISSGDGEPVWSDNNFVTSGDVANQIDTAMSAETARTESTYLKEHQSLDNYYTKSQVDAEITGATEDMATKTWVGQQGYLTQHQDLSAYAKTTAVTEDIASAMAAETARTESTYAKPSQIPSLAGYATETYVDTAIASETARTESTYLKEHQDISGKLDKTDFDTYTGATETVLAGKLDATAYTIDNTIDSASTNPVENRVINAALNGVTSSTQMEISSVDSTIQLQYRFYGNPNSSYLTTYFKETNIDGYYVIDLGDLPVGEAQNIGELRLSNIIINNTYYAFENYSPDTSNLGQKVPLSLSGTYLRMILGSLGDTYDYYLVLKANEDYVFLSATLPSIETISDHKANISDLPTAQDGSSFNQFVYDGSNNKAVLSKFAATNRQYITSSYRQSQFAFNITTWGGSASQYFANLPKGNECIDGVKTDRDSQVISKAEEALNGFSEQITLTLGSRSSTDKINMALDLYLYETNYPRYLAIPTSEAIVGMIQRVILSGTTYYVQNPISQDNYRPVTGKYQLGTRSGTFLFNKEIVGNTYIIIDTELLTLEIADSLTITRAKSIPEAISAATQNMVTSGDVATQIDTAMASETARTESTYAKPSDIPSLSGYATETWVQNQGYLTQHQDISGKLDKTDFNTYTGATQTILAGKADVGDIPTVPTNVSAFTNDAGYLTQHQSLANYYTKTEIDGMIGDIESLLASI